MMTQPQAKQRCQSISGELLTIHSQEELNFILALIWQKAAPFIGLKKQYFEDDWNLYGTWTWDDESRLKFDNWAIGEPEEYSEQRDHNYDCGIILTNEPQAGKWVSVDCHSNHTVICERSKGKLRRILF